MATARGTKSSGPQKSTSSKTSTTRKSSTTSNTDTSVESAKDTFTLDEIHSMLINSGIVSISIPVDQIITRYAAYRNLDVADVKSVLEASQMSSQILATVFEQSLLRLISTPESSSYGLMFSKSVDLASAECIDSLINIPSKPVAQPTSND